MHHKTQRVRKKQNKNNMQCAQTGTHVRRHPRTHARRCTRAYAPAKSKQQSHAGDAFRYPGTYRTHAGTLRPHTQAVLQATLSLKIALRGNFVIADIRTIWAQTSPQFRCG